MPFKSDKQRRFLWSQKPEVAKQIAHKQSGGGVYSSGIYDDSAKWWNRKMAGVPQHVGFVDDPDDITETAATNPDDPYGGRYVNPDRVAPSDRYTDLATYYTTKDRSMGRGEKELARMQIENERLRREAMKRGFVNADGSLNFQHGGEAPAMGRQPKKVTEKDRYGNQVTYEYESDQKPLDITTLISKMMDYQIPPMMEMPQSVPGIGGWSVGMADHPGEPKGTDTVPAWLTPGEFVVNKEAMDDPQNRAMVEQINNEGRMKQQAMGMQSGGWALPQGHVPMTAQESALYDYNRGFEDFWGDELDWEQEVLAHLPKPKDPENPTPAEKKQIVSALEGAKPQRMKRAPQAQGGVDWNVPLGKLFGADLSTSGSYQAMEGGNDPFSAMLKAKFKFQDGGPVPVPMSPTQALLEAREGFRRDVYLDSLKKPTVGHGHLLPSEYAGRVGEVPFSDEQLDSMFQEDMATAEAGAKRNAKKYGVNWEDLTRREKIGLTSQAFQLGEEGQGKFEKMWTNLAAGDKEGAALEALDSDWGVQTPERAKDLYSAFQPGLGFNTGGDVPPPQYAFFGKLIDSATPHSAEELYEIYNKMPPGSDNTAWEYKKYRDKYADSTIKDGARISREYQKWSRDHKQAEDQIHKELLAKQGYDLDELKKGFKGFDIKTATDEDFNKQRIFMDTWGHANNIMKREFFDNYNDGWSPSSRFQGRMNRYKNDGGFIHPDAIADAKMHRNHLTPVYAYRGYDVAQQDAMDIEDPMADLSSGWMPPVVEDTGQWDAGDAALMENYEMLEPEPAAPIPTPPAAMAMPDESSAEIPEGGENWWSGISDWAFDTSVADERNAQFNVKAAEANAEAAAENLAEMEQRVADGQPVNSHSLEMAQQAAEHTAETATDARIEAGAMIYPYEEPDPANEVVPGDPTDDMARLEEAANDSEMSNEDNPSKDSEKGTQSQGEVAAIGEEAVKKDPGALKTAEGFFKDAFSDLFDGKELARMAIMYLGSRALGYSHGGSLNWAAKQYATRLDAKQAGISKNVAEFTKSGKYTAESIGQYQKTGDVSVLKAVGDPTTVTGNTMSRTINGKQVVFQEVKVGDNTLYVSPDGRQMTAAMIEQGTDPYEPAFQKGTPEYRARRSRATNDAAGRFEEVWKAEDVWEDGEKKGSATNIRPKQAADEFWGFMESRGIDPESDEALQIMTNAYQSAIADGKTGDVKPNSLKPYLEEEYIREQTGAPEEFIVNPDAVAEGKRPQYVRQDKMRSLRNSFETTAQKHGKTSNEVFQFLLSKWQGLDPEDRKVYRGNKDESPFYIYAQQQLASIYK